MQVIAVRWWGVGEGQGRGHISVGASLHWYLNFASSTTACSLACFRVLFWAYTQTFLKCYLAKYYVIDIGAAGLPAIFNN